MITHLAFYAGWANAFGAVGAARDVFAQRGIGADQFPAASVQLLPVDRSPVMEEPAGGAVVGQCRKPDNRIGAFLR